MSVENSRKVINGYFEAGPNITHFLAEDVVYTLMGTGEEAHGADAVAEMQRQFYNVSFTARAKRSNLIVGEDGAVLEARVVGTHTGEYAGVPATGKAIDVPLCVVYDIDGPYITRARVYFELPVFLAQVGIRD
jgi:steroid delta-isomerase-like uncharacterized protein